MLHFDGKVVLVTGGSSGIGRAAAQAFADAGAKVILTARGRELGEETAAAIRQRGGNVSFVRADVSRATDVKTVLGEIVSRHGRLDAAFNNAASDVGMFQLTADFNEAQFDECMQLNLKSIWLCMKYEIEQMLKQRPRGGAIVNTSSVSGLGGSPSGALYSAAKAGVLALTKAAAQEYATSGLRVNALVAGAFRTPMLKRVFTRASGGTPEGMAQVEDRYVSLIPQGRIGAPEEAANAAVWLCSDAASYVTGHSMIVDGGMTSMLR
ncbi:MAG TPA: glucose 1-dehydrogenase [Polyangiaceae bacterium]|nr:glucose 1-dehydrogenase [Polyangiaceae bacterium]